MLTVTIDRYTLWGTRGHTMIALQYRGRDLVANYRALHRVEDLPDDIPAAKAYAKQLGFTHYRMLGERKRLPL